MNNDYEGVFRAFQPLSHTFVALRSSEQGACGPAGFVPSSFRRDRPAKEGKTGALAYVFWHWPSEGVEPRDYERGLISFHEALAGVDLRGFRGSATFRIEGAPWVGPGSRGYEDWYLLDGSSALDPLNELAVSGERKGPHDRVAGASAVGGAGGLYGFGSGEPAAVGSDLATWLTKQRGTSYGEFYDRIEPWTNAPQTSLWRRQLVLGPTPEFCVLGRPGTEFPADLSPVVVERTPLWPLA